MGGQLLLISHCGVLFTRHLELRRRALEGLLLGLENNLMGWLRPRQISTFFLGLLRKRAHNSGSRRWAHFRQEAAKGEKAHTVPRKRQVIHLHFQAPDRPLHAPARLERRAS